MYNEKKRAFTDLIFCEVKREEPDDTFEKMHKQVSLAACNKMGIYLVFTYACIVYGSKISFFAVYDVETSSTVINNMEPIVPWGNLPRVIPLTSLCSHYKVSVQKTLDGRIYAYELDLNNTKHRSLIHNAFILMSNSNEPPDPKVRISTKLTV